MLRYQEDHQKRRHSAGLIPDTERRKLGEQIGLETLVVLAVNDGD